MKITVSIKYNKDEDCRWIDTDDYTGSVKLTKEIETHSDHKIKDFLDLFKDILKLNNINEEQLCFLDGHLDSIEDYECYDLDDCIGKTIGIRLNKHFKDKFELVLEDNDCHFTEKDETEE